MAGILQGMPNIDRPGVSTEEKVNVLHRYIFSMIENFNQLNNRIFVLEQHIASIESALQDKQEV